MNDEQRNQIRILRYQGVGYMKIGKTLGLSRDIIRGYCKRHGLDGRATELVINQDEDEKFKQKITHAYCLIVTIATLETGSLRKKMQQRF